MSLFVIHPLYTTCKTRSDNVQNSVYKSLHIYRGLFKLNIYRQHLRIEVRSKLYDDLWGNVQDKVSVGDDVLGTSERDVRTALYRVNQSSYITTEMNEKGRTKCSPVLPGTETPLMSAYAWNRRAPCSS
jgi:hypothetical protein